MLPSRVDEVGRSTVKPVGNTPTRTVTISKSYSQGVNPNIVATTKGSGETGTLIALLSVFYLFAY